jgi:wyosine [tRNA(Phe)-imidazoG37] synthetase (radical SAM superfamily)
MKYLFGPVPSRRLGISLGVDLVPHKVCTLNCVYCEVGRTTNLTTERKEFIPVDELLDELKEYLDKKPELDFITFSGQGEPTLNSGLGKVINFIKDNYPKYKVAVITNGTLFYDKKVRNEVLRADLLLPSLDAVSTEIFHKINRPEKNLDNKKIINGLIDLGKEFKGKIYLEIFFIPGLNNSDEELNLLKENIIKIDPDLVQLNSLDRPGTEDSVKTMQIENLEKIKSFLEPLPVTIIAKVKSRKKIQSFNKNIEDQIMDTIKRRPCTDKDLCEILDIHINELNKYLSELISSGKIISDSKQRGLFFKPNLSDSL